MYISFLNFFQELLRGNWFRIEFKEWATFYLIDAISLVGVLLQWLFYQFSEFGWRRNVFKNFPIVLFDRAWKSFVIRISRHSFSKRRWLHIHHEESGATCENIGFFTVVFWKHSKLSHLTIYVSVVDIIFSFIWFLRLLIFYFFFSFVKRNFVIPDFRWVIYFRSDIVFKLNDWIEFLAE